MGTYTLRTRFAHIGMVLLAIGLAASGVYWWTLEPPPAEIRVRWAPEITDSVRVTREERYSLSDGDLIEGRSWGYLLTDTSVGNIRSLVEDPAIEDTDEIDRAAFRVSRESTQGQHPPTRHPRLSTAARIVAATALLFGLVLLAVTGDPAAGTRACRNGPATKLRANELRVLVSLLGTIVVLGVASEQHITVTNDEPNHLLYGRNILALDSTRFDDSKMPISALNALPGTAAGHLPSGRLRTYLEGLNAARYPTIAFSLMVGLCVFAWTRDLYGTTAGLFALTLYTFDPNLIAHAQLVTTDLYAAGTAAVALYFFWRFLNVGGWRTAVTSAATLGLAQVAKYSLVLLFPLFVVIAFGFHAMSTWNAIRDHKWGSLRTRALGFTAYAVMFVTVVLLVINASFLFNETFTPFNQYRFQSDAFHSMQSLSGVLGDVPVPLPTPYLEGLDLVIEHERTGSSYGRLYLLGQLRDGGDGFPGYYLYASLFKVPLPTLAILGVTAATLLVRRPGGFLMREAVLVFPIIVFTIYFNVFNRAQIGIRYFLVVFPLAYVLCGSLVPQGRQTPRWKAICGGLTLAALVVSVLSYYPYFLPYFNELIGRRTEAYKYLADSNIDWGQYGLAMNAYRRAHPEAIFEPNSPTAGTILVRVNRLTGVLGEPAQFEWLREHFNPVGHVAHGVLVYQVSESDLYRLRRER